MKHNLQLTSLPIEAKTPIEATTQHISPTMRYIRRGLFVAAGVFVLSFTAFAHQANAQSDGSSLDFPSSLETPSPSSGDSAGGSSAGQSTGPSLESFTPPVDVSQPGELTISRADSVDNVVPQNDSTLPSLDDPAPVTPPPPDKSPATQVVTETGDNTSVNLEGSTETRPTDATQAPPQTEGSAPAATTLDEPDGITVQVAPTNKGGVPGGVINVDGTLGDLTGNITATDNNKGAASAQGQLDLPIGDANLEVRGQINNRGPASGNVELEVPVGDDATLKVGTGSAGTTVGGTLGDPDSVNLDVNQNVSTGKTDATVNIPGEDVSVQVGGSTGGPGGSALRIGVSSPKPDRLAPFDPAAATKEATDTYNNERSTPSLEDSPLFAEPLSVPSDGTSLDATSLDDADLDADTNLESNLESNLDTNLEADTEANTEDRGLLAYGNGVVSDSTDQPLRDAVQQTSTSNADVDGADGADGVADETLIAKLPTPEVNCNGVTDSYIDSSYNNVTVLTPCQAKTKVTKETATELAVGGACSAGLKSPNAIIKGGALVCEGADAAAAIRTKILDGDADACKAEDKYLQVTEYGPVRSVRCTDTPARIDEATGPRPYDPPF
jgi:hypothetical protein